MARREGRELQFLNMFRACVPPGKVLMSVFGNADIRKDLTEEHFQIVHDALICNQDKFNSLKDVGGVNGRSISRSCTTRFFTRVGTEFNPLKHDAFFAR